MLVAEDSQGIVGTVQLVLAQPENQPHRADLSKMLVHRRARRRGIGALLMQAAEAAARANTARRCWCSTPRARRPSGSMRACGWTRVGTIPGFALLPQESRAPPPSSIANWAAESPNH
jgi:GNAT superfamily N-acetyltransferase